MSHIEKLATRRKVTICRPGLRIIVIINVILLNEDFFYFILFWTVPLHLRQPAFNMKSVWIDACNKLKLSAIKASRDPIAMRIIET